MEVREKALPDIGPLHTFESLKDPASADGGLGPWINRCAERAASEWKRLGYSAAPAPGGKSGAKEPEASDRQESAVARSVLRTFAAERADRGAPPGKDGMSRDEARCVAFDPLLKTACALRVFLHPKSLDGLHMLIESHRRWTARSARTSKGNAEAQKNLDRAKVRELTRACAVFEGRAAGSKN